MKESWKGEEEQNKNHIKLKDYQLAQKMSQMP
jgi:hypothetical protein